MVLHVDVLRQPGVAWWKAGDLMTGQGGGAEWWGGHSQHAGVTVGEQTWPSPSQAQGVLHHHPGVAWVEPVKGHGRSVLTVT